MKHIVTHIICFCFLGMFACQGQTIYVSSSTGSDINSGLDAEHPMKDLAKAVKAGNKILLKAGDTFYIGGLHVRTN